MFSAIVSLTFAMRITCFLVCNWSEGSHTKTVPLVDVYHNFHFTSIWLKPDPDRLKENGF